MRGKSMATVLHLLASKGSCRVLSVSPDTTVFEATCFMNAEHIGALLIIQDLATNRKLVGIFTERDVLRRVVATRRHPEHTSVGDVMTSEIITCTVDTPLDDLAQLMRVKRIRHLPALEKNESIAGFISIGDLNAYQAGYCQLALQEAKNYIHGRV